MRIAVFCSGNGSNLQAIIDAKAKGFIRSEIALVVSDTPGCFALERARRAGIKSVIVERKDFKTRSEFEKVILKHLKEESIDLIVLAGFMRLLSKDFVKQYKDRIMNIHPALLPAFKGTRGVHDAFEYGVKVTGPTVHFVTEEMDAGPIILQSPVIVREDDTEETLTEAIHKEEHKIYPLAIQLFEQGRLKIDGRKVRII